MGFYRNFEFIDNDDDIDVLISRSDITILKKYIDLNINKYPEIKIGINTENLLQLFFNNIGPFDIYVFDDYDCNILLKWDGNLLYEKKNIFPSKTVLFHNFNINIPYDSENVLFLTYGKNWKTPQDKNNYNWLDITNVKMLSTDIL